MTLRNPRRNAARKAGISPQHSFALEPQCTLREAEAFKAALRAAEDSSGDFIVEAGAVERIDTAGLQLLLGLAARLQVMQRRLLWGAISPALRLGARRLGLERALGLPEATS